MNKLRIPPRHLDGFTILAQMDDTAFAKFAAKLLEDFEQEHVLPYEVLQELIDSWSDQKEREIIDSLLSVFMLNVTSETLDQTFCDMFKAGFESQTKEKVNSDQLVERLKGLFERLKNFRVTLKAVSLIREEEHQFNDSRVLSDIRPLFHNHAPQQLGNYAIILHRLKLVRQDMDGFKEIYISLTKGQLEELKATIERALEKDADIRNAGKYNYLA